MENPVPWSCAGGWTTSGASSTALPWSFKMCESDSRKRGEGAGSRAAPMTLDAVAFQALNGLAAASGLFFVGAGLSLIFGVTRIVNMAHGSLYMVGLYLAYSIAATIGGGSGYWAGVVAAALLVAALGALIEIALLRRIYHVPDLFQLLATFAVVLVLNDATLWVWGPEDLLGPRAPGLRGAVDVLGRRFPAYDLFMIAMGPIVLLILHLALTRTRFGG